MSNNFFHCSGTISDWPIRDQSAPMNRKQRRAAAKLGSPATQLLATAVRLHQAGQWVAAEACYRQVLTVQPNLAEGHFRLGDALMGQGKFDQAVAAYRQAISIKPDFAKAYSNLGNALIGQGKLDEAIAACRRAIGIKPDFAKAYSNLGNALSAQGKLDEAVAAYRRAIGIKPDLAEAHSNLGGGLAAQGKLDEAVAAYRRAIGIRPDLAEAHSNLGNALFGQHKLEEAVAAYRRAIGIRPDFAKAYSNLGDALFGQHKLDEAVAAYRRAIGIRPDFAGAHSNLLLCLNYDDKLTNDHLFAAHREWDERYGEWAPTFTTYDNDRDATRRLRIGYLSPDFRQHSVAYFVEPLLRRHDRQNVEVFGYAEVSWPDSVTTRLQGLADHWLVTVGLSDQRLAERIRCDGIDILVDVAGHTAGNRLLVFARKPAPVQVTWLGYPNTTGLKAIDYRLVDAVTDPAGEADVWASETLVRLEDGFLCYGGLRDGPEPTPPPCLKTGTVTFGSFNNPAKISTVTFDAWAKLL